MSDIITVAGVVATVPRHLVTSSQVAVTSFRLASGQRRFDRSTNAWVDAGTNWYSVSAFRQLAFNAARSLDKGQHVIVTGRLRVRDWENQERNGTSIEIEAESLGHDLLWGTSTFIRNPSRSLHQQSEPEDGPSDGESREVPAMSESA